MQPKVSVCIPVYNVAEFLTGCLSSVTSQTLADIEIICVEDASTDNSDKILREYAKKDSRIKVICHEKNAGLVKTRKDAILASSGEYIMFLDSDDELFPNACEKAYEEIKSNNVDILQFGTLVINYTSNPKRDLWFWKPYIGKLENENISYTCFVENKFGWSVWNKIYNGDKLRNCCRFISDNYIVMYEDMYLNFIFFYFLNTFFGIEDNLYKYNLGIGVSDTDAKLPMPVYKARIDCKSVYDAAKLFLDNRDVKNHYCPILVKIHDILIKASVDCLRKQITHDKINEGLQYLLDVWGYEDFVEFLSQERKEKDGTIKKLKKENLTLKKKSEELKKKIVVKDSKIKEIQQSNSVLLKELKKSNDSIKRLKQSYSFRIGRIITFIPRVIRNCIKH